MSSYPVYNYTNNNNTPLTSTQVTAILNDKAVRITDAYNNSTLSVPPTRSTINSIGTHYHVANYYAPTKELVYHGR
jgi:hypothetical protein|uniref:Uncharacterized protein n=1 Tax=viral metagenome TaxID=1070528 RepID=A0A6C0IVQ5_9ZZZZ